MAPQRTQYFKKNGHIQAKRKQYGLKHHVSSTIYEVMGDTLPSVAAEISLLNSDFKLWDKGQMIVVISRTKEGKNTIFVGSKEDIIAALKSLLTRKTQWTDLEREILDIITINRSNNTTPNATRRVMTTSSFPYRICDMSLPECKTGYVYMLISIKNQDFAYIGKTNCIRTRLRQHNSGVGSTSTQPIHLRPFALHAYICGFNCNQELMFYIERKWKEVRNIKIRLGINDIKEWARCATEVIADIDEEQFGNQTSELSLVCLFKE